MILKTFSIFLLIINQISGTDLCGGKKCVNGECDDDACVCYQCFTGPSCEFIKNNAPTFTNSTYGITVNEQTISNDILVKVTANDEDKCDDCGCGEVVYSILDDSAKETFEIDPNTGELRIIPNQEVPNGQDSFLVKATNKSPFDNTYDTATVFINLETENENILDRRRRAVAPTELSFQLSQKYPPNNISVITYGQRLLFELIITFPNGKSEANLELFSSELGIKPALILCNAKVVSVGADLKANPILIKNQNGVGNKSWPYTHIVFHSLKVEHKNKNPASLKEIQVVIEFEAMLYYSTLHKNNSLYYISAGAEYLNGQKIWIGQYGYRASISTLISKPNFTLTGDVNIYSSRTAAFDILVYAPDAYVYLDMGVYPPFNNSEVFSLCIVNRYFVGEAYDCLPADYAQPFLTSTIIKNKVHYSKATMDTGTVMNKYFKEKSKRNKLDETIKIKVVVRTDISLVVNQNYYIGVSISYDNFEIYTGTHNMVAKKPGKLTDHKNSIPLNLDYGKGGSKVKLGSIGSTVVNMTIPTGTELDYDIEAGFLNDAAEILNISFKFAGLNVPCVNQLNLNIKFEKKDIYAVKAKITLPAIRHIQIRNNMSDDLLQFLVTFRPIDDPRNQGVDKITETVKISWTGGSGSDSNLDYTIDGAIPKTKQNTVVVPKTEVTTASAAKPVIKSNTKVEKLTSPGFKFYLVDNDGNVSVGLSYEFVFMARILPSAFNISSILEFYMPFNNTLQIKMAVGRAAICESTESDTSKFIFSSKKKGNTDYEKLQILVGKMCISSKKGTPFYDIEIILNLEVLTHPLNSVGAKANINMGIIISNTQIWVGTQRLKFIPFTKKPDIPSVTIPPTTVEMTTKAKLNLIMNINSSPYVFITRADSNNTAIYKNDVAILHVIIKSGPMTMITLALNISSDIVEPNNFGVCRISILSKGASILSVNGSMKSSKWSTYSKYNKTAVFTFAEIVNRGSVALVNSSTVDDNTVVVEAVLRFGDKLPKTINVFVNAIHKLGILKPKFTFHLSNSANRFDATPPNSEPKFAMFLSPLFNDAKSNIKYLAYSEALRGVVSIQVKTQQFQTLKIIFSSKGDSSRQMDVISVNILSVGRNIPCLQTGMIKYQIQSRGGSNSKDVTSINLGTVCHSKYLKSTSVEDDKIYIEAVFRVWKNPKDSPSNLMLNTITLLNNDQVYIGRAIINVTTNLQHVKNVNQSDQDIIANAKVIPLSVGIGGIFKVNVTLNIPPYTQYKDAKIIIYSENPENSDSYYFTNGDINFSGNFGVNIGINNGEPLKMTLKSTKRTSQMDYICADLGVLQNTATTYRMGQNNYTGTNSDDAISVTIPIRLTDNSLATDGKTINFVVGVNIGSFVKNISLGITATRTNKEILDFDISTKLLSRDDIYTSSDTIMASAWSQMSDSSKLECRNFTIYVATPPFIKFTTIVNSSYSSEAHSVKQNNLPQGGFYFIVPYFFYGENISVIFTMGVIPGLKLTRGRKESIITVPVIYGCKTLNWPLNANGNRWINKVESLEFYIRGADIPSCNDDLQLKDKMIIKDCAISAYMSPFADNDVQKIRSTSGSYWIPHVRGGQYNKLRYVDIKFGKLTTVTKVDIISALANKPETISVYGTMDGRAYSFYKTIDLTHNNDKSFAMLKDPPFIFRGIRISILNATKNEEIIGINIDLHGCGLKGIVDPNTFDPCLVSSFLRPTVQLPEFYHRGYLYKAPYIFICDEIAKTTNELDTYPRCFRSNIDDDVHTWEDLGNKVGKIIGFDSTNLFIYAISSDLTGYIMSENNGLTWATLNGGGWQMIKVLSNLQNPTILPWTNDTTFNHLTTGSACTKYSAGAFHFCFDGVYSGSTNIFKWNDCCSL